ncbi:MAG: outer membrane protein assembly factor BamB [Gammaproteobacteria bacterium]|jgi:outer membrane protein assembly factor BamB
MMPLLLALMFLPQSATPPADGDWTRFRGASGTSILEERAFPSEWGPDKNVAWSVDVPGSGWSSPIVANDRVFLTSAVDPEDDGPKGMSAGVRDPSTRGAGAKPEGELTFQLACYDLEDGKEIWSRDVGKRVPLYPVHRSNTFATETPTTDGERIFVTFGALGELVCFDFEGEELWRVETGVFKTGNDFGWGTSLVTVDGLVFLQNDNEEESFLAAFDTKTGKQSWRVERGLGTSWGTPVLWETAGRTSLVACGPDTVIAYNPSTGEKRWEVEGIGGSFSSSPTFDDERIYFGNSGPMSRGPLMAVNASATGKMSAKAKDSDSISWYAKRSGPGFASPVVYAGRIYILGSTNVLACHDAATGEQLWRERVPGAGQVVASPWVAGGELYIMDEAGTTVVVGTGPEYEVLRTNRMEGLYWGTPSVAGNALLLREAGTLYCIRE